ncbi:MAG: AarF/ABC1/UbiB kinase family protein [Bdellovibrionales bacterium]|nr:AarF/ABC1/UbiB kinase family protein [Bdellovibrionales bacterium]
MKSGVFGRSTKLLTMASKLARHEVVKELKNKLVSKVEERASQELKARIRQAKILAENLSDLKGAAMKAGQLLSLDSSEILPEEVTEILSQLQSSARSEPYEEMKKILLEELGDHRLAELKNLSQEPLAAASIGQVHRVTIHDKEAVLKIRYPGVVDSIDSDLKILRKVAELFLNVSGKRVDLKELFEELSIVLHQEADYLQEAQTMARFGELCQNIEGITLPKPFFEYTTKKVLAMTYTPGRPILDWIKSGPSREDREWVGRRILDLYCREFFDWGLVQTDPNYGNFKIQTEPLQLVVLDFGATLEYDAEFRKKYVELLRSFASFDHEMILKSSLSFGLIDPRESEEAKGHFVEFLKASVEPFLPQLQPFRFKDADYAKKANEVGRRFTSSLKYSAPPRKLIFLHRKLGGIFNLLRRMDVSINLTPYWKKMVGEDFITG